jgi:hypothetical protein
VRTGLPLEAKRLIIHANSDQAAAKPNSVKAGSDPGLCRLRACPGWRMSFGLLFMARPERGVWLGKGLPGGDGPQNSLPRALRSSRRRSCRGRFASRCLASRSSRSRGVPGDDAIVSIESLRRSNSDPSLWAWRLSFAFSAQSSSFSRACACALVSFLGVSGFLTSLWEASSPRRLAPRGRPRRGSYFIGRTGTMRAGSACVGFGGRSFRSADAIVDSSLKRARRRARVSVVSPAFSIRSDRRATNDLSIARRS